MHRKGFLMILCLEHFSGQKFDKEAGGNSQTALLLVSAGRGHGCSKLHDGIAACIDVSIYAHIYIYIYI